MVFDLNSISVYIFNWKKVSDNTRLLYDRIKNTLPDITVINSDENYVFPITMKTIQVDDSYYYGKQYNTAIKNIPEGKILCIIVGDVSPDTDFQLTFTNSLLSFNLHNAGIHAPNEVHTSHSTRFEHIADQIYRVPNTDCTFWMIHPDVVKAMRNIDYTISNFGWGVDVITIHYATLQGYLTLRDYAVDIHQIRKGTGYSIEIAEVQLEALKKSYFASLDVPYG